MKQKRKLSDDRYWEIFADGIDAHDSKISINANPFPVFSPEYPVWREGWMHALGAQYDQ